MDSIYLRLNKIEKRLEGEEFFEGGLSYCFEVEELKMSMEDIKPLKDVLVSVKAINASDELILKQIENSKDDIEEPCQIPCLIITAKQDTEVGYKDQFDLMEKYTSATYVAVENAGHNLQIEQPEIFESIVKSWLRTH